MYMKKNSDTFVWLQVVALIIAEIDLSGHFSFSNFSFLVAAIAIATNISRVYMFKKSGEMAAISAMKDIGNAITYAWIARSFSIFITIIYCVYAWLLWDEPGNDYKALLFIGGSIALLLTEIIYSFGEELSEKVRLSEIQNDIPSDDLIDRMIDRMKEMDKNINEEISTETITNASYNIYPPSN